MDTYEARWMDIASAAEVLGVSERTIRRREKSGHIASRREGRRVFVDVSAHMPQVEKTPDMLRQELATARRELTMMKTLLDKQDEEIQFLRSALASALRLRTVAIDAPQDEVKPRSWWPFGNK